MTIRRTILALFMAVLALAAVSPTRAYAGGPTSLLMASPTDQRATAAYCDDRVYQAMSAALAVGDDAGGALEPPASVGSDRPPTVLLTWLVHDRNVWRIDEIHLTAGDGIWVETLTDPDGSAPDGEGRWHRPASAQQLTAALTKAGLLGDGAPRRSSPSSTPKAVTSPAQAPAPAIDVARPGDAAPPVEATGGSGNPLPVLTLAAALSGLILGGLAVGVWTARRPGRVDLRG